MEELDYLNQVDVAMIAPSRVGKSSLICAMDTEFSRVSAKSDIEFESKEDDDIRQYMVETLKISRDENPVSTHAYLQSILNQYFSSVNGINFTAGGAGTKEPALLTFKLKGRADESGQEGVSMPLRILDYPGGDVSSFAKGRNKMVLRRYTKDCFALIVPVFSLALVERAKLLQELKLKGQANEEQRNQSTALDDVLQLVEVIDLVGSWCRERAQSNRKGILLFAPVKCETYFNDKERSSRANAVGFLQELVREIYFEGLQKWLKKRTDDDELVKIRKLINVEYCPVQTVGDTILRGNIRWEGSAGKVFKDVYEIDVNPVVMPYGAARVVYRVLKRRNELISAILEEQAKANINAIDQQGFFRRLYEEVTGGNTARRSEAMLFLKQAGAHRRFIDDVGQMEGDTGNRHSAVWEWPSDWVYQAKSKIVRCPHCGKDVYVEHNEKKKCWFCDGIVEGTW